MLRSNFNDMHEKVKGTLDLLISQQYDSLERVAEMSHDDLDGIKSLNESYQAFSEYVEQHTAMMDEMASKLDEIQNEIKSLKYCINDKKREQA
jgi:methyl-accepting chemotaxis protein